MSKHNSQNVKNIILIYVNSEYMSFLFNLLMLEAVIWKGWFQIYKVNGVLYNQLNKKGIPIKDSYISFKINGSVSYMAIKSQILNYYS